MLGMVIVTLALPRGRPRHVMQVRNPHALTSRTALAAPRKARPPAPARPPRTARPPAAPPAAPSARPAPPAACRARPRPAYTVWATMQLFRPDLLRGRVVALAGAVSPGVSESLSAVGAQVERFDDGLGDEDGSEWARAHVPLHALVYGAPGSDRLDDTLARAWTVIRAVATGALIPRGEGGKIVLVAPAPQAASHSSAVRAGLENLARTLSVEWARYRITVTAISLGPPAGDPQLAILIPFLASHAGDYFSGCRFELHG